MSINIIKQKLSDFNISIDTIKNSLELKDLKYNNKFIDKIYYCNKSAFSNLNNKSALIYKRKKVVLIFYKCTITFSCYDMITGEQLIIDSIQINNEIFNDCIYQENQQTDKKIYTLSFDKIFSSFNLIINKTKYLPAIIKQNISNFQQNIINTIDLGRIPLMPQDRKEGYTLIWGSDPTDLDSHIYSFNQIFEQKQHVYYPDRYDTTGYISEPSKIKLDIDDTTSYGPETITINAPLDNYYYLYTIHNYAHATHGETSNFNYNNETFIHLVHNGKVTTIQPLNIQNNGYCWLDVFVRYNNKIYIVNKQINRSYDDNYLFDINEAKNLIENYIANAQQIIQLNT